MPTPEGFLETDATGPLSSDQRAALDREVERRVAARTGELERLNLDLQQALAGKSAAEAARDHSDAHFRASFESDAVGQVHYDPKTGLILRANRCHAAMLGYAPEELVGRKGSEFTWPEDRSADAWARLVAGKVETYSREKRYIRRDGSPVWGRVSASLVRLADGGEPLLAVAVIEDIDDRYKAQLALAEAKGQLEAVVEERTAALAQRDLLLREVYHRVKNSLQVVDSLLLLTSRRLAEPEAKMALETLRARVYALGLVHHQLMGSADLETFEIGPFLEELSAHLLEGKAEASLSVRAPPLKADLDFAIPLGLIVTELVTSATSCSPGRIEVALEPGQEGWLALSVDCGACERPVGTLGATIVQGLVQQLKGTLQEEAGGRTVMRLPAPVRA